MATEDQDYSESENTEEEQGDSSEHDSESASSEGEESKDFKSLYENQKIRAEKAEQRLKKMKEAGEDEEKQDSQKQAPLQNDNTQMSAEELRLIARQGYDENEIDYLRKVSQVEGVSLAEAEKTDVFSTWYKTQQQKRKEEQAQMGGSKSSGQHTQQKQVTDPGLSEDEHRKLWQQAMDQ